jgi:hypothetical protein
MSGRGQKNRLAQEELTFPAESRRDAPKPAAQGTETRVAKRKTESLAGTERRREEVCELENCKQALQRVKANQGSPGVDGMTVEELPEYLKQHGRKIGEQLRNGTYQVAGPSHHQGTSLGESMSDPDRLGPWSRRADSAGGEGEL